MFKLLKNGHCFIPEDIGRKDILIAFDKICQIEECIQVEGLGAVEVIDCSNQIICPGLIDQHVHITGGGGEEGPISRIPEITFSEIITAGVATVVGVLGVDSVTRNIEGLLAKARALEAEGVNTYIYTGSYSVPTATLTGKVLSDMVLIDKVIGVGEIAISDHRSSHPSVDALKALVHEARVGGLVGCKAGVVHIHVGDGKKGLEPLVGILEDSEYPIEMFVPTHLNRNKALFGQAIEYIKRGGWVDLTAGETDETGYSVPEAMSRLFHENIDIEKVTVSSDANGSIPAPNGGGTGVGKVSQLFEDIRDCVLKKGLPLPQVLKTVTSNVAKVLKIYPKKGLLAAGSDADVLVLGKGDLSIRRLIVNGMLVIDQGKVIKKGRYEQ